MSFSNYHEAFSNVFSNRSTRWILSPENNKTIYFRLSGNKLTVRLPGGRRRVVKDNRIERYIIRKYNKTFDRLILEFPYLFWNNSLLMDFENNYFKVVLHPIESSEEDREIYEKLVKDTIKLYEPGIEF